MAFTALYQRIVAIRPLGHFSVAIRPCSTIFNVIAGLVVVVGYKLC